MQSVLKINKLVQTELSNTQHVHQTTGKNSLTNNHTAVSELHATTTMLLAFIKVKEVRAFDTSLHYSVIGISQY